MAKHTNLLLPTLIASPLHPNPRAFLVVVIFHAGSGRLKIELRSVGRPLARSGLANGGRLHFDAIAVRRRLNAAPGRTHLHVDGFDEGVGSCSVRCRSQSSMRSPSIGDSDCDVWKLND